MEKFLLDENLSRKLTVKLPQWMQARHVSDEDLQHTYDHAIWHFAKEQGTTIITKDNDFQYLSLTYGCPPKVIKLNCGNRTTDYIAELISQFADEIQHFLLSAELCYLEIR